MPLTAVLPTYNVPCYGTELVGTVSNTLLRVPRRHGWPAPRRERETMPNYYSLMGYKSKPVDSFDSLLFSFFPLFPVPPRLYRSLNGRRFAVSTNVTNERDREATLKRYSDIAVGLDFSRYWLGAA